MKRSATSKQSVEVEKGIPITPDRRGRTTKYPWLKMEVGDSFLLRCPSAERRRMAARMRTCRNNMRRNHNLSFEIRAVKGGLRMWRIA